MYANTYIRPAAAAVAVRWWFDVSVLCFNKHIVHIAGDGILNECLIRIKYKQSSICYG